MRSRIPHADGRRRTPPIDRTALSRAPGCRTREPRAEAAVGGVDAHCKTPAASATGSTLLDSAQELVARLAQRPADRAAGYRGALASPMAPTSMDGAVTTKTSGPPADGRRDSGPHRQDGIRQSALGCASDPWRVAQTGHRGFG